MLLPEFKDALCSFLFICTRDAGQAPSWHLRSVSSKGGAVIWKGLGSGGPGGAFCRVNPPLLSIVTSRLGSLWFTHIPDYHNHDIWCYTAAWCFPSSIKWVTQVGSWGMQADILLVIRQKGGIRVKHVCECVYVHGTGRTKLEISLSPWNTHVRVAVFTFRSAAPVWTHPDGTWSFTTERPMENTDVIIN